MVNFMLRTTLPLGKVLLVSFGEDVLWAILNVMVNKVPIPLLEVKPQLFSLFLTEV